MVFTMTTTICTYVDAWNYPPSFGQQDGKSLTSRSYHRQHARDHTQVVLSPCDKNIINVMLIIVLHVIKYTPWDSASKYPFLNPISVFDRLIGSTLILSNIQNIQQKMVFNCIKTNKLYTVLTNIIPPLAYMSSWNCLAHSSAIRQDIEVLLFAGVAIFRAIACKVMCVN